MGWGNYFVSLRICLFRSFFWVSRLLLAKTRKRFRNGVANSVEYYICIYFIDVLLYKYTYYCYLCMYVIVVYIYIYKYSVYMSVLSPSIRLYTFTNPEQLLLDRAHTFGQAAAEWMSWRHSVLHPSTAGQRQLSCFRTSSGCGGQE